MAEQSPYLLISQLVSQLNGAMSAVDIYSLDTKPRKVLIDLQRRMPDARLDVRDYELSETRDEQLRNAKTAKKRLEQVRKDILAASEYNIFNAVDVAQLTGSIDYIIERLE